MTLQTPSSREPLAAPTAPETPGMPGIPSPTPVRHRTNAASRYWAKDYFDLTKFRLSALVVITTFVGSAVATTGALDWVRLLWTLLGTGLAATGANALNQWWEVDLDRRMARTAGRPLPSGRMTRMHALIVATTLAVSGPVVLATLVNVLTATLSIITLALYVFVYTPLKVRDPSCTLVGAVVGAIPPMMGWTAVTGHLDMRAWVLFLVLFVWQIPHFLSLAWFHRDQYAGAGFRMLPIVDPSGVRTTRLILMYAIVLLPLSATIVLTGIAGWWFALGAAPVGIVFARLCWSLYRRRSSALARRVFFASLIYLPILLALMVADRGPGAGLVPWKAGRLTVISQTDRP